MRHGLTIAVRTLAAAAGLFAVSSSGSKAQDLPELNPMVHLQYEEPSFTQLYRQLKNRRILEEYSQFMSPLRLKRPLTVSIEGCGIINADYNPERHYIRLCYEFLDMVENEAAMPQARLPEPLNNAQSFPGAGLMPGFSRGEVIIGGIVQVALHETGHAIFDIQGIPRLGREEDAADQISGLMMLQFGTSLARTLIKGTINVWHHMQARTALKRQAARQVALLGDTHSLDLQRAVNYLCLAYGKDPAAFEDLTQRWLPRQRRDNCKFEYDQTLLAFQKTVLPFVDTEQLKKVQAMPILRPGDSDL